MCRIGRTQRHTSDDRCNTIRQVKHPLGDRRQGRHSHTLNRAVRISTRQVDDNQRVFITERRCNDRNRSVVDRSHGPQNQHRRISTPQTIADVICRYRNRTMVVRRRRKRIGTVCTNYQSAHTNNRCNLPRYKEFLDAITIGIDAKSSNRQGIAVWISIVRQNIPGDWCIFLHRYRTIIHCIRGSIGNNG